jgi:hypothetical protein
MTGHPTPEELAAHAAGDLDPVVATSVDSHLLTCADCAADLRAIAGLPALLAGLPPLPMPADVATALDARLAAERAGDATATVPSLTERRERRRSWFATSVAGAAAAGLVGVVALGVVQNLRTDDSRGAGGTANAEAALDAAALPPPSESGRRLTVDNVADELQTFLTDGSAPPAALSGPSARTAQDSGAGGGSGADGTGEVFTSGGDADPYARLRDPAALERCVDQVREGEARPVALDFAAFEDQPALVVVLPFRDTTVDVYVLSVATCGDPEAVDPVGLLHFQRVTRG